MTQKGFHTKGMGLSRFPQHSVVSYLLLALILFSFYFLSFYGDFLSSYDEIARYLMVENVASGKGFVALYDDAEGVQQMYYEPLPKYGFLMPLLALPFHYVGDFFQAIDSRDSSSIPVYFVPMKKKVLFWTRLFNVFVCVLLCLLFFFISRTVGYSLIPSFFTASVLGTSTLVAFYAHTFFSEPLSAVLLLLSLFFACQSGHRFALWAGVASGFLVCNNFIFIFSALILCSTVWFVHQRIQTKQACISILFFISGAGPGIVLSLLQLFIRGGSGYTAEPGFSNPLMIGLFGNILSPGKSIFLFSPILLIAFWGYKKLIDKQNTLAIVSFIHISAYTLVFSKWYNWAGGTCWGPRFLLPLIPLAMFGLLPVLTQWATMKRALKIIVLTTVILGLMVQLSATLFPSYLWFQQGALMIHIDTRDERFDDTEEGQLLEFQLFSPYFPELSPPYLQLSVSFHYFLKEGSIRFQPHWLRHGHYFIGLLLCVTIIACFLIILHFTPLNRKKRTMSHAAE